MSNRLIIIKVIFMFSALLMIAGIVLKYGFSMTCLRISIITVLLASASYTDFRFRKIPNLTVMLIGLAALLRLLEGSTWLTIISGCVPSVLIYVLIRLIERLKRQNHKKLLGGGDIKLLFVLGLHYKIFEMLYIILISCIIVLVYFIFLKKDERQGVALCPMISAGVFIISLVR